MSTRCRLCGRHATEVEGYLERVNEKGVPGIWECRPPCGASQFRKRPVVVDAWRYGGDTTQLPYEAGTAISRSVEGGSCFISTLEGEMECRPGDWIIRGVKGEFYPCKPDIFAATYERAASPSSGAAPSDEPSDPTKIAERLMAEYGPHDFDGEWTPHGAFQLACEKVIEAFAAEPRGAAPAPTPDPPRRSFFVPGLIEQATRLRLDDSNCVAPSSLISGMIEALREQEALLGGAPRDAGTPATDRRDSMNGVEMIAAERQRQVEQEGWTASHDDTHGGGELAQAAACYAWPPPRPPSVKTAYPENWDWKPVAHDLGNGYKPEDRIRELVKAGALIAAEIDRLGRGGPQTEAQT